MEAVLKATRLLDAAAQAALVVACLLAWQWLSTKGGAGIQFSSSPGHILARLRELVSSGELWSAALQTLWVALAGFAVASVLGAILGSVFALWSVVAILFGPIFVFLNSVPRLLFLPFFIIWLGFGSLSSIVHVTFVVVFIVMFNVEAAVRTVDRDILANVRLMGGRARELALHVYIPSLMGVFSNTCRLTFGIALQATVISEFIGPSRGLGHLVAMGQSTFDSSTIMAAMTAIVVLAVIFDWLFLRVERMADHWKS